MERAIIKLVTPQMQNGVHRSWTNKFTGKPNYGFNIVFGNGISGICGSEKTVFPLNPGTDVTYEITTTATGVNLISKVKKVEVNGGNAARSFNEPHTIKRIAFSMCQTIARQHFANAGIAPKTLDEVNGLAVVYNKWVVSNLPEDDPHYRDLVSRRYYALQLAVDCIPFSNLGILKREQVISSAETFLKPLMDIGHEPLV